MAIANAPQNATRKAAVMIAAPPAWADKAPSRPSDTSALSVTAQTSSDAGTSSTTSSGMAAPTEKGADEVQGACSGFAVYAGGVPKSSLAWVSNASNAINWLATWLANALSSPRLT